MLIVHKVIPLGISALLLSACANLTPQQISAMSDDEMCRTHQYQFTSLAFGQEFVERRIRCNGTVSAGRVPAVPQQVQQTEDDSSARVARMAAALGQIERDRQAQQQRNKPISTHCSQFGYGYNCTTYP